MLLWKRGPQILASSLATPEMTVPQGSIANTSLQTTGISPGTTPNSDSTAESSAEFPAKSSAKSSSKAAASANVTVPKVAPWRAWLIASRPLTLTATCVPVLVGSSVALSVFTEQLGGGANLYIFCFSMFSALLIQIATNFFNDALDTLKGSDNENRRGPPRAAQMGWLSPQSLIYAGAACLALALVLGVPLVSIGGWPIVGIGLLSLVLAYGYTGGPWPLAYLGLGDLFVMTFFGWIAVTTMIYLHTQLWLFEGLVAGTQVGALATVLIAINNLRDIDADKIANKKTLAVRLGAKGVALEIALLIGSSFVLGTYWGVAHGLIWASLLPLVTLPLAMSVMRLVWNTHRPAAALNEALRRSAILHASFGILLCVGLWLKSQ